MKRRIFLKGSVATGALVGTGLIAPRVVMAAWPKAAFDATDVNGALNGAVGSTDMSASDAIKIKAPDIAENGAVVPITVSSSISGAESITVLTEKNAAPMTASFVMGAGAEAYASTRIKMGKTSKVIAVVKSGGKLHSASKEVKVTIGGCGG